MQDKNHDSGQYRSWLKKKKEISFDNNAKAFSKNLIKKINPMKNILVPNDYSDNARNAAEYAIQLARATGASIEFLHVFPEPENVEEQEDIQQFKDLLKKEKTILTCEAKNFNTKFGIKIKTTVYPGKLHEVLKTMMFNQSADLVVVGMKGISVIDKIFWGSTTTKLLQHATFPLIIIPSEKQFTPLKHVTFAADYNSLLGENLSQF